MADSWVSPSRDHISAGIEPLRSTIETPGNATLVENPHIEGDTEEGGEQAKEDSTLLDVC